MAVSESYRYEFVGDDGYDDVRGDVKAIVNRITKDYENMSFYIAINEAVSNALLYSKSGFMTAVVVIDVRKDGKFLAVQVGSDSSGFNVGRYIDSMKELVKDDSYADWSEFLRDSPRGRGIWLMLTACDKVVYASKGDRVILISKLPCVLKTERRPKRILEKLIVNHLKK